jgi:NAD-dependent DNA ligase
MAQAAQDIAIEGRSFCFTGRGQASRESMAKAATARGGIVHRRLTRGTDYLVVGSGGSKRWAYGAYGKKTATALRLISAGGGVCIVGEAAFWKACGWGSGSPKATAGR